METETGQPCHKRLNLPDFVYTWHTSTYFISYIDMHRMQAYAIARCKLRQYSRYKTTSPKTLSWTHLSCMVQDEYLTILQIFDDKVISVKRTWELDQTLASPLAKHEIVLVYGRHHGQSRPRALLVFTVTPRPSTTIGTGG